MSGGWSSWGVGALAGALAVIAAHHVHAAEREGCRPAIVGTATIQSVLDGRTVRLADGRQARLIGLELPDRPEGAQAAKAALAALVEGRAVTLARVDQESDRYGRLPALLYLALDFETPVQKTLIAQGHGRVAARVGDRACARALHEAEQAARVAGRGLWANRHDVIKPAANPQLILAGRGTFALVEGRVLSVGQSGGTIYLNFGRRWSDDFTVTVSKRNERAFAAAGVAPQSLARRNVRVRGFVEERGGPWIEAAWPEQIEIAERD
jgi:endonuclease YncB( thermonuclease family)